MSIPELQQTIVDGGLGLLPEGIDNVHVKLGVCSSGAAASLAGFGDTSVLAAALGNGPLVDATAGALVTPTQGRSGRPVYAQRIATTATGSQSSVTAARVGTSTGVVATTGNALDSGQVRVKISRAGSRNVGAFQLSFDAGNTYAPETTIPSGGTYAPPGAGFSVTFDTGTYDVGDVFSFTAFEPSYSSAELGTALDALLANPLEWAMVHLVGVVAPEMTSVTSAGTAPPVVSLTGTPNGYHNVRIEITTGGARGTAVFRWSADGGATWTSAVTTAATVVLTGTGLTAAFATGTDYATDNVYTAHAGKGLRDRADMAKTKMVAAEAVNRYAFALLDAPPDMSDAVLIAAMTGFESVRVAVAAGPVRIFSPLTNRKLRRPFAWSAAARIAATEPHIHPGWVRLGALVDVTTTETSGGDFRDERKTETLDALRFMTSRTFIGLAGAYVTRGRLMAPAGSDYESVQNRRVMDKASRIARAAGLPFLNEDLDVNPSTSTVQSGLPGAPGTLDEKKARDIETEINGKLRAALVATRQVSEVRVQVNRTDAILSTKRLRMKLRVTPKAYAETIEQELSLVNPALQLA